MVCDDVNQDKHIMEACIWISFNKKYVYMHVLFLHAMQKPYSKEIVIPIILKRTIITSNCILLFILFLSYNCRAIYNMWLQ